MSATNRSKKSDLNFFITKDSNEVKISNGTFDFEENEKEVEKRETNRRTHKKEKKKKSEYLTTEDEENAYQNFKINSKNKQFFFSKKIQSESFDNMKKSNFYFSDDNNPFIVKSVPARTRKISHLNDDDEYDNFESFSTVKKSYDFKTKIYLFNQNEDKYLEEKYFKLLQQNQTKFLITCCPKETKIQCNILVEKKIYSEYVLYLESDQFDPNEPISFTKHKKSVISSAYSFKTTDISRYNEIVKLGELHSNLKRSNYDLIGWYENKEEESDHDRSYDEEKTDKDFIETNKKHKKYFKLNFSNKLIGELKPKDINLVLNLFKENLATLNSNKKSKKKNIVSKHPEYDSKTKTYTMDFQDRAMLPSSNNIQLIDKYDPYESVILQIGKIKDNRYTLDFTYPFSIFSAFGFAVSCLTHN